MDEVFSNGGLRSWMIAMIFHSCTTLCICLGEMSANSSFCPSWWKQTTRNSLSPSQILAVTEGVDSVKLKGNIRNHHLLNSLKKRTQERVYHTSHPHNASFMHALLCFNLRPTPSERAWSAWHKRFHRPPTMRLWPKFFPWPCGKGSPSSRAVLECYLLWLEPIISQFGCCVILDAF